MTRRQRKNLIACLCAVILAASTCLAGLGVSLAHYQRETQKDTVLSATVAPKVTSDLLTEDGRTILLKNWQVPVEAEDPNSDPGEDPSGTDPGNENPGSNDPGNEDPGNEPGGENPGNDPGGENPGGNDPGNEDPGNEPGGENPGGNDPGNEDPGNEPGGENPGNDPDGGQNWLEPSGEALLEADNLDRLLAVGGYSLSSHKAADAPQEGDPGEDPGEEPDPGQDPGESSSDNGDPGQDPGSEEPSSEQSTEDTDPTDPANETGPSESDPNATDPNGSEPDETDPSGSDPEETSPAESETDPASVEDPDDDPTQPSETEPSRGNTVPNEIDGIPLLPGAYQCFEFTMEAPALAKISHVSNYQCRVYFGDSVDSSGLNKLTGAAPGGAPVQTVLKAKDAGREAQGNTPASQTFTVWLILDGSAYDLTEAVNVQISITWMDPSPTPNSPGTLSAHWFVTVLQPASEDNGSTGDAGAGEGSDSGDGPDLDGGDLDDPGSGTGEAGAGEGSAEGGGANLDGLDGDPDDTGSGTGNAGAGEGSETGSGDTGSSDPAEEPRIETRLGTGEDLPETLVLRVDGFDLSEILTFTVGIQSRTLEAHSRREDPGEDPATLPETPEEGEDKDYIWKADTQELPLGAFAGLEVSLDGEYFLCLQDEAQWGIPGGKISQWFSQVKQSGTWNGLLYLRFTDAVLELDTRTLRYGADGESTSVSFRELFSVPEITWDHLTDASATYTRYALSVTGRGTEEAGWTDKVTAAQAAGRELTHLSSAVQTVDSAQTLQVEAFQMTDSSGADTRTLNCPKTWQGAVREYSVAQLVRSGSGTGWQTVATGGTRLHVDNSADSMVRVSLGSSENESALSAGTYRLTLRWRLSAEEGGAVLAEKTVYFFITY